jgi:hypothetical protein
LNFELEEICDLGWGDSLQESKHEHPFSFASLAAWQ